MLRGHHKPTSSPVIFGSLPLLGRPVQTFYNIHVPVLLKEVRKRTRLSLKNLWTINNFLNLLVSISVVNCHFADFVITDKQSTGCVAATVLLLYVFRLV